MPHHESAADQQAFWNDVFGSIDRSADELLDQMQRASDQFPNLVSAFALTIAYVGHLHRSLRESVPTYPVFGLPETFCERAPLICQCANGSTTACRALDPGQKFVEAEPAETCAELWQKYLKALQREREAWQEAISHPGVLFERDPNQLSLVTLRESQRLLEEMRARRCLIPVSLG
jgi:hypothetical protein